MKIIKRVLKWLGGLILLAVVSLSVVVMLRQNRTFDVPMPTLRASTDPAVIERGRYLAEGPAHCFDCHVDSRRMDAYRRGETVLPAGGYEISIPPGVFRAANITSDRATGIAGLSDGQIVRALRLGVRRDGRALMPFMAFQHLADDDMVAILSYIRSLPPVAHAVSASTYSILGRALFALLIRPEGPTRPVPRHVDAGPTVSNGDYIANNVANCRGCHTNRDMRTGEFIGPPFGGGVHFPSEVDRSMEFVVPNITRHATGRLGARFTTEDSFVARLRAGVGPTGTPMPWRSYSRMSDDDLRALYRYLQTVSPVDNRTPEGAQRSS